MKVTSLDHLNLSVRDFDETAAWYGRVFGFEVMEEAVNADDVRWGVLRSEDAMLCIYEHPDLEHVPCDEQRRRGMHAICHFGLRIRDREAWEETIKREKLDLQWGGAIQYGHSTSWYVTDPTGWSIEVALWENDTVSFA
ncbi:MAG: VOC family protein [Planctomycetota bacterium]|jgi:catechol 2,3-dioxygenase-like lactoylglutathione lyase family enzyme